MSKVVIVKYWISDAFKIPKGLYLEDKTQVKYWWVKWNELHIVKADDTKLLIEPEGWSSDVDFKEPSSDPTIEDRKDYGMDDSEDEEDEEKETQEHKQDEEHKEEDKPNRIIVKRIELNGEKYLKTADNTLYNPETKEAVGIWDSETNTIKEMPEEEDEDNDEEE